MTLYEFLVTALGGGIVALLIELLLKRGKIKLDQSHVKLFYRGKVAGDFGINHLVNFNLELQFLNTSGHQRIIKNISVRFFDGLNFLPLKFENINVSPAGMIEPKTVKILPYNLLPHKKNAVVPMQQIYEDKAYLEITYNVKNRKEIKYIYGTEMELIDIGKYYADASY